jgi:hypothetical protein
MGFGVGGKVGPFRGGISTRGVGAGVGPFSAGTGCLGQSSCGLVLTALFLFLFFLGPYFLGQYIATKISPESQLARTIWSWTLESLWLGLLLFIVILNIAGAWSEARAKKIQTKSQIPPTNAQVDQLLEATTPAIAQGWYPDPLNAQQKRFWDGTRWTDQVGPLP